MLPVTVGLQGSWCADGLVDKSWCLMVSGQALHELEALLLESVASQQEAAKLCAAQWASRLFPLSHVPSRYVCVIAAGDAKLEVRDAGGAGLKGPTTPSSGELRLVHTAGHALILQNKPLSSLPPMHLGYDGGGEGAF